MKIKEGYVLKTVGGVHVVIPLETRQDGKNGIIRLNEAGKFLWEMLCAGAEKIALVDGLLSSYDVTREVAEQDVDSFIKMLEAAEVFE